MDWPPQVLEVTGMVTSTPKTALPEPSPAVVVTVLVSVAGWPGGVACSVAVAVRVVSHVPSAVVPKVTFMLVSS